MPERLSETSESIEDVLASLNEAELDLEDLPRKDPAIFLSVQIPNIVVELNYKHPDSPTTKSLTCLLTKLQNQSTDSRYLNKDRVREIFSKNWSDFAEQGYTDSARRDATWAAKWSSDWRVLMGRLIDLDNTIRNGLALIDATYQVHGDTVLAARRMNDWGMRQQRNARSILSCYR
jgi:hypothetical protein